MLSPACTDTFAGATSIESGFGRATVSTTLPLTAPSWARIVVVPAATPDTRPATLALSTVATALSSDDQVASKVRSAFDSSLYLPSTVSCTVPPGRTVGFDG